MRDELLRPQEVAKYLGVKDQTLAQWRWLGKGPKFRKIEGGVRYHSDDVEKFIAQSERTSTKKRRGSSN